MPRIDFGKGYVHYRLISPGKMYFINGTFKTVPLKQHNITPEILKITGNRIQTDRKLRRRYKIILGKLRQEPCVRLNQQHKSCWAVQALLEPYHLFKRLRSKRDELNLIYDYYDFWLNLIKWTKNQYNSGNITKLQKRAILKADGLEITNPEMDLVKSGLPDNKYNSLINFRQESNNLMNKLYRTV